MGSFTFSRLKGLQHVSLVKSGFRVWQFVRTLGETFQNQSCLIHAAAISFYAFLGLPALLSVFFWLTNLVVSAERVESKVIEFVDKQFGEGQSEFVARIVSATKPEDSTFLPFSLVELSGALLAATGLLLHLQYSLNKIWQVDSPRWNTSVFLAWFLKRGLSLALLLAVIVIFFLSLFISTFAAIIFSIFPFEELERLGVPQGANLWLLQTGLSFLFLLCALTLLYFFLPDKKIPLKLALLGGVFAAVFLVVGKEIAAWYIATRNFEKSFGAASSLAAFMLWEYYSVTIFLLGAVISFTWRTVKNGDRSLDVDSSVTGSL